MRKKSLTLPLAVILETVILASCSGHFSVTDGHLMQVGPQHYKIVDIYNGQLPSEKAGKTYYDMLGNVYTQLAVDDSDQIKAEVDNKLEKDFYEAARTNARNNGTSEKEEREKILNENNVDTVEEYRAKLTMEAKKTQATDRFYSDPNLNTGANNDNVGLTSQYIEETAPYHVKHILVKVTAATGELHRGKITDKEAKNISDVVERLATHLENFGVIAQQKSEDEGSRENGGDLGIMDKNTGFVPEFKLGTYAWDMFYNSKIADHSKTDVIAPGADANLNLAAYSGSADPADNEYVLGAIPLSAAFAMDYYATTTDSHGGKVQNAIDVNYPRNVLFNSYFNSHAVSLIYVDADSESSAASLLANNYGMTDVSDMAAAIASASTSNGATTVGNLGLDNKLFNYDYNYEPAGSTVGNKPKPGAVATDRPILTDRDGNPILVVRAGNNSSGAASQAEDSGSYEGIHFITVAKDPFVANLDDLKNYYYLDVRKSMEDAGVTTDFVNYIGANKDIAKYNERANKIREAVKKTDKNMEYKLYASNKKAVADKGITVEVPQIIEETAKNYVDVNINDNDKSDLESFNGTWINYMGGLIGQRETLSASIPLNSIKNFMNGIIPPYYLYDGTNWVAKNAVGDGWEFYEGGANAPDPTPNKSFVYNPAWVEKTN